MQNNQDDPRMVRLGLQKVRMLDVGRMMPGCGLPIKTVYLDTPLEKHSAVAKCRMKPG